MRKAAFLSLTLSALACAVPSARAGWLFDRRDDCAPCTRHAKGEYGAEHCRAKLLSDLDCAGLTAFAERDRARFNAWTQSRVLRPVAESAPPPSSATLVAPTPLQPVAIPATETPTAPKPKPE